QARRRRRLSELRDRVCGLEGQGPADGRRCAGALFHRPSASAARSGLERADFHALKRIAPMSSLQKRLGRTRLAQAVLGRLAASYLGLVWKTSRFQLDPADIYEAVEPDLPLIVAM